MIWQKGISALFISACLWSLASPLLSQDLLLRNTQIVDPSLQQVYLGSILIKDNKIQKIFREPPLDVTTEIIELSGKWVIPGLNDMHVHSYGNIAPGGKAQILMTKGVIKNMLYAGVTGFLDLFSAENYIFSLRNQQRQHGLTGADIYCAGPILTCTNGHGTEYGIPTREINSPAEAREEIIDLAQKRPDVIKIVYDHAAKRLFPTMTKPTMRMAIKTAKAHGINTVVHIGTWQDAEEAILAGVTAITHLYKGEIPDELVALMRHKNVFAIPTMAVLTELAHFTQNPDHLDNKLLSAITTPNLVNAYRDTSAFAERTKRWLQAQNRNQATYYRSLKKLADAGVKILTGTDAGNLGTFQGFSVHRELEIMVEAGLSSWQALAAATTVAGEFLGKNFGLQEGGLANLIVLSASPIENISNTQTIEMIIHRGRIVDRQHLINSSGF